MSKKIKPPPKHERVRTAAERRTIVATRAASPHEQVLGAGDRVETHGIERVDRVVDSIEQMKKRGQITEQQKQAADIYGANYLAQFVGLTGTLNPDKVGGGGVPGKHPPLDAMAAAEKIAGADKVLGERDTLIVSRIAGRGYSIEQCAASVYGTDANDRVGRDDRLATGRRLREGLDALVKLWKIEPPKSTRARAYRTDTPDAAYATEGAQDFTRRVAHAAGRGKLEWSGK